MELRTERLTLREFVPGDWERVLAYQRDPRYLRFNPWEERTESDVRAFVQGFITGQQVNPRRSYQLAITRRSDGWLIGNCGVRIKNYEGRIGDIGYELDPLEWGQGYATEAAGAMLAFGFDSLGLHRIWPIASPTTLPRPTCSRSWA
jgi:RimJ/RimL family protein N-acetyltransferase